MTGSQLDAILVLSRLGGRLVNTFPLLNYLAGVLVNIVCLLKCMTWV